MKNVYFAPEVGAGTVGGSITGVMVILSSQEIIQTIIAAIIGTVVSFGVSLGLKWVIKKIKKKDYQSP